MTAPNERGGKRRKLLLLGIGIVLVLALLALGLNTLMGKHSSQKSKPPKITLLTPPTPPPPPPPPKFEKKPDPPKEQKEMKVEQAPAPKAEQATPPELKMDGPAGDGPSGFASGKITSDDVSKLGTGKVATAKTGMFNPFDNYAAQTKGELQRYLHKNAGLTRSQYMVKVRVWVGGDGSVKRFELVGSSGDNAIDEAIQAAIQAFAGFSQAPPSDMPQPISLRITTHA
jgi:protein TonB